MMSSIYDDIGNDKMKLTQNYEHYLDTIMDRCLNFRRTEDTTLDSKTKSSQGGTNE